MQVIKNVKLSLNFNVREKQAKPTDTIVYCVVKVNDKQMKLSCDLKVNASRWDKRKQECTVSAYMVESERENSINVNRKINAIKIAYNDYFNYLCSCESVSTDEITDTIKTIVSQQKENVIMANPHAIPPKRTTTATTIIKKAFEMKYPKDATKESTRNTYERFLNAFLTYIKDAKLGDTPKLLTQDGLNDYKDYLLNHGNSAKGINQYCSLICRLINDVLCVKSDFRKYGFSIVRYTNIKDTRKKDDNKKKALTQEEIQAITNAQNLTEKEKEYRDIFIMQLNCGVRFSDLEKLFNGDYIEETNEGITTYIVNTQKEGITAAIIATDTIKALQNKYKDGFKFVDFSNGSKYNEYLRKVAEKANLTQIEKYCVNKGGKNVEKEERFCDVISSHYARHTFITMKRREGYSEEEVSKMTGHADTAMIHKIYEHLDDSDKAKQVAKAHKRITAQQENQTESTENNSVNDAIIAAQAKENFKLKIDNDINFTLKKINMYNDAIRVKNGDTISEMDISDFLKDFPNNDEFILIYGGEKVIDVVRERFAKHNATLTDEYKIIQVDNI